MSQGIGARGVALRIGAALVLVLATFNPTDYSYLRWALRDVSNFTPLQALLGLLLLAGWVLYVRAALHALGLVGVGSPGRTCGAG